MLVKLDEPPPAGCRHGAPGPMPRTAALASSAPEPSAGGGARTLARARQLPPTARARGLAAQASPPLATRLPPSPPQVTIVNSCYACKMADASALLECVVEEWEALHAAATSPPAALRKA